MLSRIRTIFGFAIFIVSLPLFMLVDRMRKRNPREYGLTRETRDFEIVRKFGAPSAPKVDALLSAVEHPEDKVLGAIVFLANTPDQIGELVALANNDRDALLNAATVKDERG